MNIEDSFYGSDKLFTLKDASDAAVMRRMLGPELPRWAGADARLVDLQLEVLRRRLAARDI
jgi:hypothetical protein